jgi:hypothetical protein
LRGSLKHFGTTTFTPFQPNVIDNPARIFRRLTISVLLRRLSRIDAMHDDRLSDSCALKIVPCFGTDIECCEYLLIWQQPRPESNIYTFRRLLLQPHIATPDLLPRLHPIFSFLYHGSGGRLGCYPGAIGHVRTYYIESDAEELT